MLHKGSIFAQSGSLDPTKTNTDFQLGHFPGTTAKAEDVNTYGNMSDAELKAVCNEVENAITGYGVTLDPNSSTQLENVLKNKVGGGTGQTGIDYSTFTTAPTQAGNAINFATFDILFNNEVFYGKTQGDFTRVTIAAQTVSATGAWDDGVHFIYSDNNGNILHQQEMIQGSDGDTKCMLGSVFVISGIFQTDSWKFQPWLQITSAETRESSTAQTKGGMMMAAGGIKLQMGALEVKAEGINFAVNKYDPNIMQMGALNPYPYKFLYKDYNPSLPSATDVDTTHLYNMTSGTWDDISSHEGYICLVPCIAPTGQTLMIPAMSTKAGATYASIFSSIDEASDAVFSLTYDLDNVAKRSIYLGQTLIVKIGADDFTDPTQFMVVGLVPQELASFTNNGGQGGGVPGSYMPMPEVTWTATSLILQNNASNYVTGSASVPVTVFMPVNQIDTVNQVILKYFHDTGFQGMTFESSVKWWSGHLPVFTTGQNTIIIFDYISGSWYGREINANMYAPIGSLVTYAVSTTPAGYLYCDGSAISRTSYSALFAVIGTKFGAGDGSTTFNLPIRNDPLTEVYRATISNQQVVIYSNGSMDITATAGFTGGSKTFSVPFESAPAAVGGGVDQYAGERQIYAYVSGTTATTIIISERTDNVFRWAVTGMASKTWLATNLPRRFNASGDPNLFYVFIKY